MGRTRRRGGKSIFSDVFEYVTGPEKTPNERAIIKITKDLDATKSIFKKEKEAVDKELAEIDSKSKENVLRIKKEDLADTLTKIDALTEAFKYTFKIPPPVKTPDTPSPSLTPLSPLSDSPESSLPSAALSSAALSSAALSSTALPSTSLPSTSLPSTSLPSTSLPSTSLPSTSLPSTSLPGAPQYGADLEPDDMQDYNMGPGPDFNNMGPDYNMGEMGPGYGPGPADFNNRGPNPYRMGGSRRLARERKRRSLRLRR
jgi:hypothetical protein